MIITLLSTVVLGIDFCYAEDIYQRLNNDGTTTIENKMSVGSKKMTLPSIAVYINPVSKSDVATQLSEQSHTTQTMPRTHVLDERNRKIVLEEELAHEKTALANSLLLLNQAKQSSTNIKSISNLNYNVVEHQKNIEILTKLLTK